MALRLVLSMFLLAVSANFNPADEPTQYWVLTVNGKKQSEFKSQAEVDKLLPRYQKLYSGKDVAVQGPFTRGNAAAIVAPAPMPTDPKGGVSGSPSSATNGPSSTGGAGTNGTTAGSASGGQTSPTETSANQGGLANTVKTPPISGSDELKKLLEDAWVGTANAVTYLTQDLAPRLSYGITTDRVGRAIGNAWDVWYAKNMTKMVTTGATCASAAIPVFTPVAAPACAKAAAGLLIDFGLETAIQLVGILEADGIITSTEMHYMAAGLEGIRTVASVIQSVGATDKIITVAVAAFDMLVDDEKLGIGVHNFTDAAKYVKGLLGVIKKK